jgi:hypothetical protein
MTNATETAASSGGGDDSSGDSLIDGVSDTLLSEGIISGLSIVLGLLISMVGRQLPMLGGGSLVLGLILASLMKSGQEENPDISQWPWWPLIILGIALSIMVPLIIFLRRAVNAIVSGVVFAVVTLSIVSLTPLQLIAIGLPIAAIVMLLGFLLGWMLSDPEIDPEDTKGLMQSWFYIGLCGLTGAFLLVDGCAYFISGRDLAFDIAHSIIHAGRDNAKSGNAVAVVISWLAVSVVLPICRPFLSKAWERYKPSMFRDDDDKLPLDHRSGNLQMAPSMYGKQHYNDSV